MKRIAEFNNPLVLDSVVYFVGSVFMTLGIAVCLVFACYCVQSRISFSGANHSVLVLVITFNMLN